MKKLILVLLATSFISSNLFASTRVCQVGYFNETEGNVFIAKGATEMNGFFQYQFDGKQFMVASKQGKSLNSLYYVIHNLGSGHVAQADLVYPTLTLVEKVENSINDLMYNDGKGKTYYLTCAIQE
jgi:hypothetical protein